MLKNKKLKKFKSKIGQLPPDVKNFELLPVALEIGFSIALPIVFLALGGRFLDQYLDSSPFYLLIGILTSLVVSCYLIYVKMRPYL